jgi:predicted acylesterase/phospholipase RssA
MMASTKRAPRIGLALAGGGPLAAVYEIGALAALEEAIEGFDANQADVYVGISAGGIVAAGLANGITPHQMVRLFIESDQAARDHDPDELFRPEMLMKPASAELARRLLSIPGLLAGASFDYARSRRSFAASFERLKEAFPVGVLSGEPIHAYLRGMFTRKGRSNDFRQLARKLYIVATDLDSGDAVRLGGAGWDDVPISLAVQASAAVPGLYPPVEIKGRHFVDGALRKTMHASIALEHGVDVLFCVNPIVPYNARRPGKLAAGGLLDVLSQTLRATLHSRLDAAMERYQKTHPGTDIVLLQPNEDDAELFFTNIFSYSNRRRMCEQAYQNTRLMLLARRHELEPKLARHGLRLKEAVLRDTSLTLVTEPFPRMPLARLRQALDELERYLKVAGA